MKELRILFVLGLILVSSSAIQAKKYQLTYKLKVDTEFTLLHTMEQEIIQEVMGQSQVINNTLSTRYLFKVLEVGADGNYLIEEQVDGMKMKVENDFLNLEYDSDKDSEPPAEIKSMANIFHVPIKFVLSPKGEILEVRDAEEYLSLMNETTGGDGNPMTQMVTGLVSQMKDLNGIKSSLGGIFFNYPEGKIKVGASWGGETKSQQMVKFKNVTENTLVEADKEEVVIKQTAKIEQMDSSDGMEMEGMTINFELSGRREAGHQLALASGLLNKVDALTEISGIVSIESPQLPTPMSIPMTINMKETIEQIK